MIQEVSNHFDVLVSVHHSIDKMLENLSQEQWLYRVNGTFNNIASIMHHVTLVEKKFMSAVAGQVLDLDSGAPFRATTWDVPAIQQAWSEVLPYSKSVLEAVTESDLSKPGLTLRSGELNRRQLIVYAIAHATHHRGQIPLIVKSM